MKTERERERGVSGASICQDGSRDGVAQKVGAVVWGPQESRGGTFWSYRALSDQAAGRLELSGR